MAFKKASFMTDTSETSDVAEITNFLRRFADLMSKGQNAAYLHRAAVLMETLTARVTAVTDEQQLWRYKYETVTHHADALEAECDALKHDIEGHVDITTSILTERDALKTALQAREAELSEIGAALNRERGEFATKLEAHQELQAELRAAFDREREAFKATADARGEELDQLHRTLEREREERAAKIRTHEEELSELRLAFDRERDQLQAQLGARGDELAALRVAADRENDALKAKVAALEAKRAELRSAFDRIGELRNQAIEHQGGAGRSGSEKPGLAAEANPLPARPGDRDPAAAETNAVVPKTTLRQARAQFEYLARECIPRGDIASQVMCELGAYTMDLALVAGGKTDHSPAGEIALSILAPPGSASPAVAETI
jgi:septal ring factor EnvC (AmiA/AmiB activator)